MVGRHPAVVVGEDGGQQRGEAGEAQQPGHHCTGRLEFRNFDIDTFRELNPEKGLLYSFLLDFIAKYLEKAANAGLPSENVKVIAVLSKGKLQTHLF